MMDGLPTTAPLIDPTTLTTEQLHREIAALATLFDVRVTEGFLRIEQRFDLVERWRIEQKADTKEAVTAALIAQKEAVQLQTEASERAIAKSETATTKQLEQLTQTFQTAFEGVRRDIENVKERGAGTERRAVAISAKEQGGLEVRNGLYALAGFIVALVTIGGIVLAAAK